MVIIVEIDKFAITKILVDQGSSIDILYWKTFRKMKILDSEIQPYEEQIVGFSGKRVDTQGYIDLYTTFGEDGSLAKTIKIRYLLVNANTSYNILLDRSSINRLKDIVSTPHLAMKFPSATGHIAIVHVDQNFVRECYATSLKIEPTRRLYKTSPRGRSQEWEGQALENPQKREITDHMMALVDLDPRLDDVRMEAGEDLEPLALSDDEHKTYIGSSLKSDDRRSISSTLMNNADLFAWTTADIPGVSPDVITPPVHLQRG